MGLGLGWGLGCTCVPGEAGALQIPFLGQDCSTGLKLCPDFFRRFINFLSEPEPSFELPAKIILFCWFVGFFFPSLRPHGFL